MVFLSFFLFLLLLPEMPAKRRLQRSQGAGQGCDCGLQASNTRQESIAGMALCTARSHMILEATPCVIRGAHQGTSNCRSDIYMKVATIVHEASP